MTTEQQLFKVFVYGTLKTGEPNHNVFSNLNGSYYKLMCEAETVDKYPLIIATKYNIPFLLFSVGNGTNVKGEIYEVNAVELAALDVLEDHPNFYVREESYVKSLDGHSQTHKVWIYFIKNFKEKLLNEPTYEKYTSELQGSKYVQSEESTLDDLNNFV